MKITGLGFSLLLLLAAIDVMSESVPSAINYQGRLTDAAGAPLPAGTYGVAFRIWDRQSLGAGQTLVWGRDYDVTIVEGGAFNVILGAPGGRTLADNPPPAVNDLAFAFGESNRFLGLMITRDANGQAVVNPKELVPRQQILSAPYALEAQRAQVANSVITEVANLLAPPGTVIAWMGTNNVPPAGWELCWGQEVSRTDAKYARLFWVIGISNGSGNGTTTFRLPDLRGMFLRGVNGGRSGSFADLDASIRTNAVAGGAISNAVGSVQLDALQNHRHLPLEGWDFLRGDQGLIPAGNGSFGGRNNETGLIKPDAIARIANETRPKNVYVHYLIKL